MKESYKKITREQIERALIDIFYRREELGTLPITIQLHITDSIFLATVDGKLNTGVGGFITIIDNYVNPIHFNLIVNGSLYIGEQKKKFIQQIKEQYEKKNPSY